MVGLRWGWPASQLAVECGPRAWSGELFFAALQEQPRCWCLEWRSTLTTPTEGTPCCRSPTTPGATRESRAGGKAAKRHADMLLGRLLLELMHTCAPASPTPPGEGGSLTRSLMLTCGRASVKHWPRRQASRGKAVKRNAASGIATHRKLDTCAEHSPPWEAMAPALPRRLNKQKRTPPFEAPGRGPERGVEQECGRGTFAT